MKHLQKFNENIKIPGIRDYIVSTMNKADNSIVNFLTNNVGVIILTKPSYYDVRYNNIPEDLKNWFVNDHLFLKKDEVRFATPEEIKIYKIGKTLNKYNL